MKHSFILNLTRVTLGCSLSLLLGACAGSQLAIGVPATATADARSAWTLHSIYTFMGGRDGESPVSGVVALHAKDYPQIIGTTTQGGYYLAGTVYGLIKSGKAWKEQLLYQFGGADGWEPMGIAVPKSLNEATPVFVTSFRGGSHGGGTFIALQANSSGTWTGLSSYSFGGKRDGSGPMGPVIEDASGNLYGTTCCGGAHGLGTVYRVQHTTSGYIERAIYSFKGGRDGDYPRGGLIDINGVLYGTTEYGGAEGSLGTIFKLTPSGSGFTESIVYAFSGVPDGVHPYSGLCLGPDGAFYGTTLEGGTNKDGTVFKLFHSSSGRTGYSERVVWSFGGFIGDGTNPWGPVIVDKAGVIYGTTVSFRVYSGTSDGTFFTLTPKGRHYKEKLYDFDGYNGSGPESGPTADGEGNVYMPTYGGGPQFSGAVAEAKGAVGGTNCDPGSVTESE